METNYNKCWRHSTNQKPPKVVTHSSVVEFSVVMRENWVHVRVSTLLRSFHCDTTLAMWKPSIKLSRCIIQSRCKLPQKPPKYAINFELPEMAKKWRFGLFRPNMPQLGLFHPYFVCKSSFRVISRIQIVMLDQSKPILLILKNKKPKI